jgi:hypothetical protein
MLVACTSSSNQQQSPTPGVVIACTLVDLQAAVAGMLWCYCEHAFASSCGQYASTESFQAVCAPIACYMCVLWCWQQVL